MKEQDYLISNQMYDLLMKVVTLVLPALATLYAGLSAAWGEDTLPNPEAVIATLTALATFGGVLLRMADKSWANSENKYDGELITTGVDEVTGIPNLKLNVTSDPNTLAAKDSIRLKSIDANQVV